MTGRRPLRVVMLIESLEGGGAERFTVGLARALSDRGLDVVVCGSRDPGDGSRALPHPRGVRALSLGRRRTLSPVAWFRLVRYLRRERVDVLHSHMFGSNVWGVLIGRLARVPAVISTEHSWTYEGQLHRRLIDRYWVGPRSSAFVAVSPEDARRMREIERVPANRIRTITTGLLRDPEEVASATGRLRAELGLPDEAVLVGTVANMRPMKGVDVLISAWGRIASRRPNAHLMIVGDGPLRPAIEAQVSELGLADSVRLLGTREDIPQILRSLDVVAMPSDSEGAPIALIEAMVAGRAIVATRVGAMPTMLGDGACGVLVPKRDPAALADAVDALLDDPRLRAELGEAAHRRAMAEYTLERVAERWEGLYRELLG